MATAAGVYYSFKDNSFRVTQPDNIFGGIVIMKTRKGKPGELIEVNATNYEHKLGADLRFNPMFYSLGLMLDVTSSLYVLRFGKNFRIDNFYFDPTFVAGYSKDFATIEQLEANATAVGDLMWLGMDSPGKWADYAFRFNYIPSERTYPVQLSFGSTATPQPQTPSGTLPEDPPNPTIEVENTVVGSRGPYNIGDEARAFVTIAGATTVADTVMFRAMNAFRFVDTSDPSNTHKYLYLCDPRDGYSEDTPDGSYPLIGYNPRYDTIGGGTTGYLPYSRFAHRVLNPNYDPQQPPGDSSLPVSGSNPNPMYLCMLVQYGKVILEEGTDMIVIIYDCSPFQMTNMSVEFHNITVLPPTYQLTMATTDFTVPLVNRTYSVLEQFPLSISFDPAQFYDKADPTKDYSAGYYYKDVPLLAEYADWVIGFADQFDKDNPPTSATLPMLGAVYQDTDNTQPFYIDTTANPDLSPLVGNPVWFTMEGGSNGPDKLYASDLNLQPLEEVNVPIVLAPGISDLAILNRIIAKCSDKDKVDKAFFAAVPDFSSSLDAIDWMKGLTNSEHVNATWISDYTELETGNTRIPQDVGKFILYANMFNANQHIMYPPAGHTYGSISTASNLMKTDYFRFQNELKGANINYAIVDELGACFWEQRTNKGGLESDLTYIMTYFILRDIKYKVLQVMKGFPFSILNTQLLSSVEMTLRNVLDPFQVRGFLTSYSVTMPSIADITAANRVANIVLRCTVVQDVEIFNIEMNLDSM